MFPPQFTFPSNLSCSARIVSLVLALIAAAGGAIPAAALTINAQLTSNWKNMAPPQATDDLMNYVIPEYERDFNNNVSITIQFDWSTNLPLTGALGATNFPQIIQNPSNPANQYSLAVTENLLKTAAQQNNSPALTTAVKHLPFTYPCGTSCTGMFFIPDAQYVALTGKPQNNDQTNAIVTVAATPPTLGDAASGGWDFNKFSTANDMSDFTAVLEHEISHAMGRVEYADQGPPFLTHLDFYRYNGSPPSLDPNKDLAGFSLNGGKDSLPVPPADFVQFSIQGDASDWQNVDFNSPSSKCGSDTSNGHDSYNNCSGAGVHQMVSTVDIWEMEALGWNPSMPCLGECYNVFLAKPPSSANSLTVVLQGNVLGNIDPGQTANDPRLNPFAYVNQYAYGGAGTSSVTVSLDNQGNTDITYSGSHPIKSTDTFDYGSGSSNPHFGFEGTGPNSDGFFAPLKLLTDYWTSSGVNTALASVAITCPDLVGPEVNYAIIFIDVAANGQTSGQWGECPETVGKPVTFALTNFTPDVDILSDVGIALLPFDVMLSELNVASFPPTGEPGSVFLDLPLCDVVLQSGGSIACTASSSVPEPSTIWLLGIGLVGLLVRRAPPRRLGC